MTESSRSVLLDTSVVVRYLTLDPPHLARAAVTLIDGDRQLFLSPIALVETAFTLTTAYRIDRDDVVAALSAFLQKRNVRLLHLSKASVVEALDLCRGSNRVSFADALLWAECRNLPESSVATFDRRFPTEGVEVEQLDATA